jgi:hypothetical protein
MYAVETRNLIDFVEKKLDRALVLGVLKLISLLILGP